MSKLKQTKCVACEGGVEPLGRQEVDKLMTDITGWELAKNAKSIGKDLIFKNFDKAMDFVNMVADIAEIEGHHPDIKISYNKVRLDLTTHTIKGLSINDFVIAAKIDGVDL